MANNNIAFQVNANFPKSVHRYMEVLPTCGIVHPSNFGGHCICMQQQPFGKHQQMETPKTESERYTQPQWNSVLKQVHQIEALQTHPPPKFKTTADLTPRSKAVIAPKITQKMNFNAGQSVFRNLTPLNVNDSILLPKQVTSIRKKYIKTANKMPAPELCDFLEPLPPLVHIIPEPEINQEFPKPCFDYFGSYLRCYCE